ncbi:MAG: type II toxin-antitoxin system HicB family antitoxin [Candidatus Aminicenantes bacterium]|nr:type II toxin-antitoxin system HicB family antitoxin [Candidatus Aminicenantes bacterium]
MKYKVNLIETEAGVSVWVPGLPGCWAHGRTEAEALDNIKAAIVSYLEALDEVNADLEYRTVEVG